MMVRTVDAKTRNVLLRMTGKPPPAPGYRLYPHTSPRETGRIIIIITIYILLLLTSNDGVGEEKIGLKMISEEERRRDVCFWICLELGFKKALRLTTFAGRLLVLTGVPLALVVDPVYFLERLR